MSRGLNYNQAAGLQGMLKEGSKSMEGVDEAVIRNIEAAKQLARICSSSMGPNGLKKLVVNHLEKIIVTSDCATILKELEVQHPAAKMLVLAAMMQEKECGDATNLTVSFAGELLKKAEDLLHTGLHTSEIVAGYRVAFEKAMEILPTLTVHTVDDPRDAAQVSQVLESVLGTKYFGYQATLAPYVTQACQAVMPPAPKKPSLNVDSVRVCKLQGGTIGDSLVMKGIVVSRNTEGTIKRAVKAKVAVYGCGIEASSTETKGTVLIRNAEDLLNYNKGEEKLMEDIIKGIAESGVAVVVTGGSISEMALHFMERYKLMVVKIQSKWELRRLCGAVNATALVRLGPPTAEEAGFVDVAEVREVGGRKITVFEQDAEESRVASIILRASTHNVLEDLERAVDDGVNTVKVLCTDGRFLPGAGAVEIELARRIYKLADASTGLDQYAMRKFAEALEIVPRTLAESSGQDATDTVAALYAEHEKGNSSAGVDVEGTGVKVEVGGEGGRGVYDSLFVKDSALRLAVDAALTVLRVDQIIMSKPAGGPKPPAGGGGDED